MGTFEKRKTILPKQVVVIQRVKKEYEDFLYPVNHLNQRKSPSATRVSKEKIKLSFYSQIWNMYHLFRHFLFVLAVLKWHWSFSTAASNENCHKAVYGKGCNSYIHMDNYNSYGVQGGSTTLEECA